MHKLPLLINQPASLKQLIACLDTVSCFAFDTEFMRITTYWPRMCLVQLAWRAKHGICVRAVDLLADGLDFEPLWRLFEHKKILKIAHAPAQDLEGLHHHFRVNTQTIFDTQVAAMCLDTVYAPSYQHLVASYLEKEVDKTHQRSDWTARPLQTEKINYALDDVRFLLPLYDLLQERLEKKKRDIWMQEEMQQAEMQSIRKPWPTLPKLKVREFLGLSGPKRHLMETFLLWREHKAQAEDISRQKILSDKTMARLWKQHVQHQKSDMSKEHKNITPYEKEAQAWLLHQWKSEDQASSHPESYHPESLQEERLGAKEREKLKGLQEKVKACADDLGIPVPFLATKNTLISWVRTSTLPLGGWREQVLNTFLVFDTES